MKNAFPFPWPFRKPIYKIQLNTTAPTPIPKNFLFNADTFLYNYREIHGNCKCDTCITDIMERYIKQILVQPTGWDSLKDKIAEKITWTEERIHDKENPEKVLDWLLNELRRMSS